jgi:hypothetical protein
MHNIKITEEVEDLFWSKVEIKNPESCWVWAGTKNRRYGQFHFRGDTIPAHRVSWMINRGPIPRGLWALHACDNPPCVNPDHLWLGTHTDNIKDMWDKGRGASAEKNGRTQISTETAKHIKILLGIGTRVPVICSFLNVTRMTVYAIKDGRSWKTATTPLEPSEFSNQQIH